MISVGLTGGIACGKSTVAAWFREQGVPVLDLDQVAREVVAPGEPALAEIAAAWPHVVVDGQLDRRQLGALIVADPEAKRRLEAITHPRIWERAEAWMAHQAAAGAGLVLVEAALMVETGSYRRYDQLLVVTASPEIQQKRLAAREGYDAATVSRWLAAQLPLAEKERLANLVIHNDGDRAALEHQALDALTRLRALSISRG